MTQGRGDKGPGSDNSFAGSPPVSGQQSLLALALYDSDIS